MEEKTVEFWTKKLNFTQKELANECGVSDISVFNWKKNGEIPKKYIPKLEQLLKNKQTTKYGSNVNGDGNSVQHDSNNTNNVYNYGTEHQQGAMCNFNEEQFSRIINLIESLNKHCSVKDAQIQFCTDQIQKLIRERDDLQKQLLEIYRTGKINRE